MNANALRKSTPLERPARDEWGLYDPQQAGLQALMRTLDADEPPSAATTSLADEAPDDEHIYGGMHEAPVRSRAVSRTPPEATTPPTAPAKPTIGALYTLEAPACCPECNQEIQTLRVLRVLRTQVSFTSTLPRKGYVIVCPECARVLSAELSGLV